MLQVFKRLYYESAKPDLFPVTGSRLTAGVVIGIDLAISLALYLSAYSMAGSHIAGFVAAAIMLWLFRLSGFDKSVTVFPLDGSISKGRFIVYGLLQLALRAGCIASLVYLGLPAWLALVLGILVATLLGAYSSSLLLTHSTGWPGLGIALAVSLFALRLVYLGALPVLPQEAYYWNYAQHLSPGYLDHPPLVAATIYSGEFLFGHNFWGSRIGAFIYGLAFIVIFYRFARLQVEKNTALVASALALLLPYFFMGSGFLITPDASLTLAWVMALYFFYRILVNNEHRAWYGVGFAMGIGLLSKYTIALLAPAALLFILFDPQARRQLLRKEPYIAVIISILVFSPVIYWNATHNWASFEFQAVGRFDDIPQLSLDVMLKNILALVTPLPLLALPYLFVSNPVRQTEKIQSPFTPRVRLFIGSFLLLPLAVFAWNALEHEPRPNWTGPLWISLLPMLAWLVVHGGGVRWRVLGWLLEKTTAPLLMLLISVYALLLHFMTIGLPGVDFPRGAARLLGWPDAVRNLQAIQKQLPTGTERVVVGMDKYFIASKLSYYGTPEYLGDDQRLQVTGSHLLGGNSLMYSYWNPAENYKGATVTMLSVSREALSDRNTAAYFDKLSPVFAFPVYREDFGLGRQTIREYYYRTGFGYRPPE